MFDYNLKSLSPQGWQPCTRKIFDELTQREDVLAICLELRQLYDQFDEGRLLKSTFQDRKGQLKKRLPAFAFHAHFPDGKRANKTAIASGLCMIDIDNLADPHELWADILSHLMKDERRESRDENLSLDERRESRDENPLRDADNSSFFILHSSLKKDPAAGNASPLRVGATLAVARTAQRAVPPHDDDIRDVPSRRATARVAPTSNGNADTRDNDILDQAPSAMPLRDADNSSFFILHSSLLLAHITPSGHGLRLVLRIDNTLRNYPPADAIIRTQELVRQWFISVLGKDPGIDLACKDLARISFAVPDSYILYLDERLFENEELRMKNEECHTADADRDENPLRVADTNAPSANDAHPLRVAATHDPAADDANPLRDTDIHDPADNDANIRDVPSRRATAALVPMSAEPQACLEGSAECSRGYPRVAPTSNGNAATREDLADPQDDAHHSPFTIHHSLQFKGMAYSSIIDKYWDVMGGPPADGERNTKLHQLAYHLRYICDFNAELLQKVMPTFGLSDKEMHDLIQSALKAPRYSYSSVMKKVLGKLELENDKNNINKDNADFADEEPPAMPSELPPLVELLTSCTPDAYKAAVAHGIFPPLATHLRNVRFRYIDNVEHEATLMCLLMAGSSAGKSCLSMPIRYLMADIRQRDDENLLREKLWKKECTSLGANQEKPPRPEGLIIQEIDPDITNPAFVQRMKEAEPSPLYACMNEVEQFDNLRSSRGSKAQFQIMCYAFDPGNRYGQTRVGINSVTEKVCVRFNWNASTTINKGQRYFKTVVNDGPLSRINVCTIPPAPIGAEMPVYGIYPDDFAKQLQPYLDQLCRAHGLLLIPEATDFAWRMVDRNAQTSALTQNPVFEHLSFRAAVIAWLKACVLYVAHGYQWDQRIEDFCQWSMDYDLWCKMRFFSQAIEDAMKNETVTPWRKDNLLNKLKDTFTRYDVERARAEAGAKTPVRSILSIWTRRGFVTKNKDGSYSKRDLQPA